MLEYGFETRRMIPDVNDWGRVTLHDGSVVARARSGRQEIAIVELLRFGLSLWLRELTEEKFLPQFAMLDEHRYHQLLTWPVLYPHPQPSDVLILGGGDYLAAWRVLMRRGVRRVKIADWDKQVAELVLTNIPAVRDLGVHDDPRVDFGEEINVAEYLPETTDVFDVVIGDLVDAPTLQTFLPNFHEQVFRILKPGGVFVTQAGMLSLVEHDLTLLADAVGPFRQRFASVWLYGYPIESFTYCQAFLAAWRDRAVQPQPPLRREFAKRFEESMLKKDRPFYDPVIHRAAFTLDPVIRKAVGL